MIDMNDPEVIESLKYLLVPKEEKIRTQAQPFDSKKNFFVVDKEEGYVPAEITKEDGDNVTLATRNNKTVTVKRDALLQMNPPKYEKCDDMADLTYLNDATVYHNLRERYVNWYIYTYSGLFCVTINPFRRLPLYTMKMVDFYRGKKKNEVPPHLYLVADNAYSCMTRDRANQSMLITGESGAGKTENTKKVIQYFAFVAANVNPKKAKAEDANKPSLEDQIVSANPVLEAYGNAKTTRNNNSSRFGKFIRIHFTSNFGIAGADIESYLLEKSRITYCMELERNYHIFYQLCSPALPELQKEIMLEPDAGKYFYINQGKLTIDKVDDAQEMRDTKKAFDILLFTQQQQLDLFKCTAAVAIWGNSKWKQRPREEQAEPDGTDEVNKAAALFGIDEADLLKGLTKPRIKVGNEFVNKGQNKDQVTNSVGALSKAVFSRAFAWLVEVVNVTLDVKELKRAHFIGVLDIAGFETFEYNGFEQICINFTNERLQQFFNNFMFVLEQAEYTKEGIVWETMSFGADLQATIDLIEKPLGIFSILEEECIVPKATDMTFKEKLYKQHLGKHPSFGKPKPKKGSKFEAHFDLNHYAGVVSYSVDGWLEKNKDPINMTVAALFKASKTNQLLSYLFQDIGVEEAGGAGKKGKSGSQQTISSGHREQLNKLMRTLDATHPHFVRCIIPNEIKTGGILDAHLVMHQLHCNGVLEGIRICRKGYPSRLLFAEFLQRYGILAAEVVKKTPDAKKASAGVLEEIKMDTELYRIGLTKVLFKAGVLGSLEEMRDAVITKILTLLQSQMRRYLVKKNIKKMLEQKKALTILQKNLKAFVALKTWSWMNLMNNIKPLLQNSKKEEERLAREAEEARLAEIARIEKEAAEAAAREAERLAKEKAEQERLEKERKLANELNDLREKAESGEQMVKKLSLQKADLESQVKDLEDRVAEQESKGGDLAKQKKKLESEINDLKKSIDEVNSHLNRAEADNKSKDNQIKKLQDEMAQQDDNIAKLSKEKKRLEENNSKTTESLQQEEDKVNILSKIKAKLEATVEECEENLEREKKGRADLDKVKRKLEGDLKSAQATIEEVERLKSDLEESVRRQASEISGLNGRVEEEHAQYNVALKKIKEVQQRLAESEEETEAEKQGRVRAEKQRADLARELGELSDKLEEAGGVTAAQVELNKKREAELVKLRQDLEAANIQHEVSAAQLRKKSQEALNELSLQVDLLQKAKIKLEKDHQATKSLVNEAKAQTEETNKAKANLERLAKQLESQLQELSGKLEEANRQTSDVSAAKSKLQSENANLLSQLGEAESKVAGFAKVKQQLNSQTEEAKRSAEEESRAKNSLAQQLRNLNADFSVLKSQLDEESSLKTEAQKLLGKANAEAQQWKSKYESEGLVKAEELEEAKRKLAAKLAEAEEQVEQALAKCSGLEKVKHRLQCDMEDLMVDVEKAHASASAMDKRQKQFDRAISDWKHKCEAVTGELEASQKEARQFSADVFKLKAQYQEAQDSIEALRRDNKNLSDEVRDLVEQLGSGGKSVHEAEKARKKAEEEKAELHAALDELAMLYEREEAKVSLAQLEAATARQEIDRRVREKEEEFENTKRNHSRAIDSMQASLEGEVKSKAEVLRLKKKLESDVTELEVALDHANRVNGDLQKSCKKLQQGLIEQQSQIEDEQKQKAELREAAAAADRRANSAQSSVEEQRASLEQAERARKAVEAELHEAINQIGQMGATCASVNAQKRKLENDLALLQADLDEASSELKAANDKAARATNEAARVAEELRQQREQASSVEKVRKALEAQCKEMSAKLEEAEANSQKGGKRVVQKLEQRVQELETELESEQASSQEALKESKRNERRLKEMAAAVDEEKRNQLRLQDAVSQLQNKVRAYKQQIEETEEIAALNLAKFRKVQHELNDVAQRADEAENQLAKQRARARSSVSVGRDF